MIRLIPRLQSKIQNKSADMAAKVSKYNPYNVPEDFKEFAKLCQIRSGTDFVAFELFDYQEEISKLYDRCRGLAVLKTRQTGWSETVSCKMLHRSMLSPAYLGVAFSLGQSESSKLSDRVGLMPARFDGFKWAVDSKTARKSEKGGEILFRPSTPNSARSLASVTDLFLDECGFPDDIEEMYGNATPAQSMVGEKARRILGTTIPPEGLDCWFGNTFWSDLPFDLHEEIARVQEGRGRQDKGFSYWIDSDGWARILLHWQSHPIYSSVPNYLERVKQSERINEDQLQREHNLGLPKAAGSLFSLEAIDQYAIGKWSPSVRNHYYLATLDPNMGGADFWSLLIWDISTHPIQLVAEYRENNRLPSYCRQQSLKLIDQYNVTLLAIEKNNGGLSQAEDFATARPKLRVETVNTTGISKIINTDRIALCLTDGDVVYPPDWVGIKEMRKFSRKDRCAMTGATDDAVMSWAVGFAMLEDALASIPRQTASAPVGRKLTMPSSLKGLRR